MNPAALLALANAARRRRGEAQARIPFQDAVSAGHALASAGVPAGAVAAGDLPDLRVLAAAVARLASDMAHGRPLTTAAVRAADRLAGSSTGRMRLEIADGHLRAGLAWHDASLTGQLARQVAEELAGIDPRRLRECARKECTLLFYDLSRPGTQRWHADNPCGWLERQHRRRAGPPRSRPEPAGS